MKALRPLVFVTTFAMCATTANAFQVLANDFFNYNGALTVGMGIRSVIHSARRSVV